MWQMPLLLISLSTPEQELEERKCNYERYRGLVQNDFANSEYLAPLNVFKMKPQFICYTEL